MMLSDDLLRAIDELTPEAMATIAAAVGTLGRDELQLFLPALIDKRAALGVRLGRARDANRERGERIEANLYRDTHAQRDFLRKQIRLVEARFTRLRTEAAAERRARETQRLADVEARKSAERMARRRGQRDVARLAQRYAKELRVAGREDAASAVLELVAAIDRDLVGDESAVSVSPAVPSAGRPGPTSTPAGPV